MIWKEFYPAPINKLFILYNGQWVYMKRFDGNGPSILFDPYGPNRDYWPETSKNSEELSDADSSLMSDEY